MRIERLAKNIRPSPDQNVQVKLMGNICELKHMQKEPQAHIRKLDKDNYIDLTTGEVKEFQHHEKRIDDFTSISQSLKRLRELINCNATTDVKKCKWLTLTYAENQKDTERLYKDFKYFNSRLRYFLNKNGHPPYNYLAVAEPQKRGAWHLHVFMIFSCNAPFIHYDVIKNAWQKGAIQIKAMDNIDNVGAYLTPYLTDIDIVDCVNDKNLKINDIREVEEVDEGGNKVDKAYIKGGRLKLYPAGMRLYRASRGIKRPVVYECTEKQAIQSVEGAALTYEKTIKIYDEKADTVINVINYRQYNKKANVKRGDKESV